MKKRGRKRKDVNIDEECKENVKKRGRKIKVEDVNNDCQSVKSELVL